MFVVLLLFVLILSCGLFIVVCRLGVVHTHLGGESTHAPTMFASSTGGSSLIYNGRPAFAKLLKPPGVPTQI